MGKLQVLLLSCIMYLILVDGVFYISLLVLGYLAIFHYILHYLIL